MKRLIIVFAVALISVLPALGLASDWGIDADHSTIQFKVRHMMVSNVRGTFGKFSGSATLDDKDITKSKFAASIETASINTGVAKRDEHLKSPDFFDAAKYPTITFVSKNIKKAGPNKLKLTGDLTMHGVTKEVTLDMEEPAAAVKDPWGNIKRGTSATATINRKDFGLTWNAPIESGGVVVGEDVNISIDLELVKK
ncbi:MAG: YceI family protein [Nitrospirae bacterium]|nr:YceI family protein [Nitrospirota bacterium]